MNLAILIFALAGMAFSLLRLGNQMRSTRLFPEPGFGDWTTSLARVVPITNRGQAELAKDLIRGGALYETALSNYLAARNLALMLWTLFSVGLPAFDLAVFSPFWCWIAFAGAVVIVGLPRTIVRIRSRKRAQSINQELPDVLDLLAMMMSGGMTMNESLEQAIDEFDETHPALAAELRIVSRQAMTGTLDLALEAFAVRLDLPEVSALTAMLRGGHRSGGSLVEALRSFADGLRHTRDQQAREQGNKASIKLLLPVVFCLAPPIYILLLGPAFLDLKDFVERENRPGGALAPTVQASQPSGPLTRDPARREAAAARVAGNPPSQSR